MIAKEGGYDGQCHAPTVGTRVVETGTRTDSEWVGWAEEYHGEWSLLPAQGICDNRHPMLEITLYTGIGTE